MKKFIKSVLVLSISTFIMTSCSDDQEFDAPVISNLEIGEGHHDHDHAKAKDNVVSFRGGEEAVGHIGEDLHIEADIVADGKIAYIMVEIHNETTGVEVVEEKFIEGFVGLKNTNFHKHVDIPSNTAEGEYHFHIKVVDQLGKETEEEKELMLEVEEEETTVEAAK